MSKILILCTGNSCRSQIAEGFLRHYCDLYNKQVQVVSAGVETHGVNPKAIQTMAEVGINISNHTSNLVDEFLNDGVTHLISVCDHAIETCPVFPKKIEHIHRSFSDPAKVTGSKTEIMASFENVRNEIDSFCKKYILENF